MDEGNYSGLIWKIATIALGVLLMVAVVVIILYGVKLSKYDKNKAAEIVNELTSQETELKKQCQAEKEVTLNTYKATDVYGNFEFQYPSIWYTNLTEEPGGSEAFTFLGHPTLITNNQTNPPVVALRIIYFNTKYESKIKSYGNLFKTSEVTVSGIKGTRFVGTSKQSGKKMSFILLPLRDKTIYIGTDDVNTFSAEYDKVLGTFVLHK